MALGQEMEVIESVKPIEPYQERLPCLEPIVTITGIEFALHELLKTMSPSFAGTKGTSHCHIQRVSG
jgi:hypothetical protein